MKHFAAVIEYDGSNYHGWQRQSKQIGVQNIVETALSKIANENILVNCAGRTDARVHAIYQVINFSISTLRTPNQLLAGCNSLLPNDIVVKWLNTVDEEFHARFSALYRSYIYVIYNADTPSALWDNFCTHYKYSLDASKMNEAVQLIKGRHNFQSFRSSRCQSNSNMRNITHAKVWRRDEMIFLQLTANAFLHHMVRNIVGMLLAIGNEQKPVSWMSDVLHAQDRNKADITAPANGLYLHEVGYDAKFNLPIFNHSKIFVWQL